MGVFVKYFGDFIFLLGDLPLLRNVFLFLVKHNLEMLHTVIISLAEHLGTGQTAKKKKKKQTYIFPSSLPVGIGSI